MNNQQHIQRLIQWCTEDCDFVYYTSFNVARANCIALNALDTRERWKVVLLDDGRYWIQRDQ